MLTLITGGCRSGKSARAIALGGSHPGSRKFFVATAEPRDDEMRDRIMHHRKSRPPEFQTVEEPRALVGALKSLDRRADVVVVDCLTLWVSNLLEVFTDDEVLAEAGTFASVLGQASFSTFVVTDEVGWGLVPENPVGRRFRDLLGWTNQKLASAADQVLLMVAGYSLRVK
jgi:adenosylcobinamide kinase/adenosylcobinamide-phosphate guanylyltransferase